MARYKVVLAYDGTDFQGFQRQSEGRTVQSAVEQSLQSIGWQGSSLLAAGRTDLGVHATGQVVAFDLEWRHSIQELANALNANLPPDISAREVELIEENFHPRFSALSRIYQYRLFCDQARHPLRERYSWRVWPSVSLEAMNLVASRLVGRSDFSAFGAPTRPGGSTERHIFAAYWIGDKDDFIFEITGNSFLYHMVRRLVFFQVDVGQGKRKPEQLEDLLKSKTKVRSQGLAPAHGLTLIKVNYSSESPGQDNELIK